MNKPEAKSNRTVLIADDDKTSIEIISDVVKSAGWNVLSAPDGQRAIDIIEKTPVHALILDMRMPVLDGYEVCLELFRRGTKIPTLVITGCLSDNEPLGYLGVSQTLPKPVKSSDILKFIASC